MGGNWKEEKKGMNKEKEGERREKGEATEGREGGREGKDRSISECIIRE